MSLFDKWLNRDKNKGQEESIPEESQLEEFVHDKTEEDIGFSEESYEIKESVEEEENPPEEEGQEESVKEKKGFFSKLVKGLAKTRNNIMDGIDNVLKSFNKIDEELYEELEETLIMADIGVNASIKIMNGLREKVKERKINEPAALKQLLIEEITEILSKGNRDLNIQEGPAVILVIGVNGVGKTTTIGKLAHLIKKENKKVLLAAADTFRAAAIEQLEIWGNRTGVDVIRHQENSDPGAVVFDAIQAAKARKIDVLICDTAGRLHNKKNLMEELRKIFKIINKEYPEARKEVLLVLDATTGQNALQQVKLFKEVTDISGIILTKLDGTAKGGIIIAINSEMDIPIKYIGVGEGIEDLRPFNPKEFAEALFTDEE
ncbi:MAG TPA: signal recognition particle-docking protein FtsY [Defluviitaleaceae bacterium]|nr:signal recognition particle-docking protein FtsY [Defluviitaleaceae bacterium]HPT76788.1 signal recognition particle-docking protein FtsY [Defluviitaleaceae bacterium]HQD50581.1 signal recognition particle-docking protein FtsY [Defluviitaleaceae bacterium]